MKGCNHTVSTKVYAIYKSDLLGYKLLILNIKNSKRERERERERREANKD